MNTAAKELILPIMLGVVCLPLIGFLSMIVCIVHSKLRFCVIPGLLFAFIGSAIGNHLGKGTGSIAALYYAICIGSIFWLLTPAIYCLFFQNLRKASIIFLTLAGIWPLLWGSMWSINSYERHVTTREWLWWETTLATQPPAVELQEARKHLSEEMKRRLREYIMQDRLASPETRKISDETLLYLDDVGISVTCYIPLSPKLAQELNTRHPLDSELASNPSTPGDILREMSDGNRFFVLRLLCKNPSLSDNLADKLKSRLEKYMEEKNAADDLRGRDYYWADQGLCSLKQRSYRARNAKQQKPDQPDQ